MGFTAGAAAVNRANLALMTSRKKARKVKHRLSVVPYAKEEIKSTHRLGEIKDQKDSTLTTNILRATVVLVWIAVFALVIMAFATFWNQ